MSCAACIVSAFSTRFLAESLLRASCSCFLSGVSAGKCGSRQSLRMVRRISSGVRSTFSTPFFRPISSSRSSVSWFSVPSFTSPTKPPASSLLLSSPPARNTWPIDAAQKLKVFTRRDKEREIILFKRLKDRHTETISPESFIETMKSFEILYEAVAACASAGFMERISVTRSDARIIDESVSCVHHFLVRSIWQYGEHPPCFRAVAGAHLRDADAVAIWVCGVKGGCRFCEELGAMKHEAVRERLLQALGFPREQG